MSTPDDIKAWAERLERAMAEDRYLQKQQKHTFEPVTPSLVGGPMCGLGVKVVAHKWTVLFSDPLRKQIHTYERRTPNDPSYYFKGSGKLYQLPRGEK